MFHKVLNSKSCIEAFLSRIGLLNSEKISKETVISGSGSSGSHTGVDKEMAVIGTGSFGSTFLKKVAGTAIEPEKIIASNPSGSNFSELNDLGIETTNSNIEAVSRSDLIFLAVEPGQVREVLEEINLTNDKVLVSVAAGVSIDFIQSFCSAKVVRAMPNINVQVAEAAIGYSKSENITEDEEKKVREIFKSVGTIYNVDETKLEAVTGLSGSGPAFVYTVIEAMMNAGIENGLTREESIKLTLQTVKGSAEMVDKSSKSVEELIDMVSTPNGTTIEGIKVFEETDFQDSLVKAIDAATKRAEELSR